MNQITIEQLHQFRNYINQQASKIKSGSELLDFLMETCKGKLRFIARGSFGNVFYLDKPFPMAVKFVPGSKESSYKAQKQASTAKKLESLLINKSTPHISAIITAFWIKTAELPKEAIHFPKKNRQPMPNTLVIFSEWADSGDLLALMRKRRISWLELKVYIFQILFTLAKIQEKYKGFKHNDLKSNNILLCNDYSKANYRLYNFNKNLSFKIPVLQYTVKINDFDLTSLNSKNPNHYSDMHFFIATTVKFSRNFSQNMPDEFYKFAESILDKKGPFKASNPCRYIGNEQPKTPLQVLMNNPIFKDFIISK